MAVIPAVTPRRGTTPSLISPAAHTIRRLVGFYSKAPHWQLNTALGAGTLLTNTGDNNTATGAGALLNNTSGNSNTANGSNALFNNTIGSVNTANGVNTLLNNSNSTKAAQFGLIAEEVAAVNPDLVVRDKDGEVYTVRYDPVITMLLNEFLKEHPKAEQM
jgi:hypothetical protein